MRQGRMRDPETCDFCAEFSKSGDHALARIYGSSFDRTITELPGFRVIPSLGQVGPAHLMLVPVQHVEAFGALNEDDIRRADVELEAIRVALQERFGSCIFWEHGSCGGDSGGCGIRHAHIHAVGLNQPIFALPTIEGAKWRRIGGIVELMEIARANHSYLYMALSSEERYLTEVRDLPSQFMRRWVAERIGQIEWDWRKVGQESQVIQLCSRIPGPPSS